MVFRVMVILLLLVYYTTFTMVCKEGGLILGDHNSVNPRNITAPNESSTKLRIYNVVIQVPF